MTLAHKDSKEKSKDMIHSKAESIAPALNAPTNKLLDRSNLTAGEKVYRDYLNLERKRELEEILQQFKKETEAKFMEFTKDIGYLGEMLKYISQVRSC